MQTTVHHRSLASLVPGAKMRLWVVLAGLALALPVAGVQALRATEPDAPSPAEGHAEVIAQGVARMPANAVAWRVVEREAPVTPDAAQPSDLRLGFVLADGGPIMLRAGGERYRLAPGEAFLVEDGDEPRYSSLGNRPAGLYSLELLPAATVKGRAEGTVLYRGDGFDVTGRDYDLDLVRDLLARNEETELEDAGIPVLVLATDGTIEVETEQGKAVELAEGEAAAFEGALRLTGGAETSVFVAAVIGADVTAESPARPTETPTEPPAPTADNAPPPSTSVPRPTATPAGNGPDDDPDGDGLTNADEDLRGTDGRDADSDDDGLTDGFETFQSGTLPLDADSDDDGLDDGDEVNRGTNPSSADSDGDGLDDGNEVANTGTDPKLSDTDGDGFADGAEVAANTNPIDPTSHP